MDTAIWKEKLEAALRDVTEELKGLGVHNPENEADWVATPVGTEVAEADENVSADKAEELEERAAILADLERRYNSTRKALGRIALGTFGICEVGGETIEPERLDANPAARTCIEHREEEGSLV
jgi:RNA polymerase-binding transcription factor DksA